MDTGVVEKIKGDALYAPACWVVQRATGGKGLRGQRVVQRDGKAVEARRHQQRCDIRLQGLELECQMGGLKG